MDLAPQEERIVLGHLESCESCAKFHHQLQQVILAAEEVPLPDEMLPGKEEQLARMIMQQLPAAKASPFAFLDAIFTKFKNGKQAAPASSGGSMFPHRSGSIRDLDAEQTDSGRQSRGGTRTKQQQQDEEEHAGTNSRLKAMKSTFDSEALYESTREAQSRTLGEKFGMAAPSNSVDDQPLTLAESIRRKISDSAKPVQAEEADLDDETEMEAMPAGMPAAMASTSGSPSPIQAGTTPIGQSFAPPEPGSVPNPGSAWSKTTPIDGGTWTPSGQTGTGANSDWGGATTGSAPASFAPGQEKPKGSWGPSGWDNAGSTAASKSNEWGGAPQDGFDTAKVQTPAGWGQPPAAPSPVQPLAASAQASAPIPPQVPAPQPKPAPAQVPAPQAPGPTGGFAQSGPGWGVSPTSTTPAGGASADPWGGGSAADDSWGGAASQKGWATTEAAKAPTGWGQTATPTTGSWGQSGAQPTVPSALPPAIPPPVVQPQPQIAPPMPAPAAVQPSSHDWASTKPQQGGWGTPTDANEWGAPAPVPAAPKAVATPTHEAKPAWSLEAEQIETGTWRAFSPGADALGARPAAPAMKQADPLTGPKEDDRWSTPIQDRVKSGGAAAPTQPGFAPPAMPAPAPAFQPQAPAFQPQTPAPAAKTAIEEPPSHSKSGWNFPVYEPDEVLNEPAWGTPAPVAQAPAPAPPAPVMPAQSASQKPALPVDSIMDKLGTVLSDAAKSGPSSPTPSSWDLSIQEKQLQKAQEPAQFAPPEPAPQPNAQAASTPSDWTDAQPPAPFPTTFPDTSQWGGFAQNESVPASFVPGVAPPATFVPGVEVPAVPPAPAQPDKKSLFKLDDSAIDKLFNENLGVKDQAIPPSRGSAPLVTPPPAPAPTAWEQGSWSQAAAPAQNLPSDPAATGWSTPQEPKAPQTAPAWGSPQAAPNVAPPAPPAPGPSQAPAAPAPGWGSTSQNQGSNWGSPAQEPAAPAQPAPTPGWGNPAPAPAVPQAAASWAPPQTPAPAPAWPQTQAPQTAPGWDSPAPEPPAMPAAAQSWGAESVAPQAAPTWGEAQAAPSWPAPAPASPPAQSWEAQPAVAAPQAAPGWGTAPEPTVPGDNGPGPKISGVTARSAGPSPAGNGFAAGQDRRESGQFSPPAAPEPANKDKQGLFDLDDSAMDQLFRQNLGVEEASTSVTGQPPEPAPAATSSMIPPPPPGWTPPPIAPVNQQPPQASGWPQPAPASPPQSGGWAQPAPSQPQPRQPAPPVQPPAPQVNQGWGQPQAQGWGSAGGGNDAPNTPPTPPAQQPAAQPTQGGGLFAIDDNVIDKIFADNLGVSEQQGNTMPKSNPQPQPSMYVETTPAPITPPQPAPQSAPQPAQFSGPPPKIEGIGRLDSRVDNSAEQGSGRIASIGKFLLDQKDLEKITKLTDSDLSDSSMRILTTEAAQELNTLLHHIGTLPSVVGSVIVGHDGLLIANTMPPDIEAESIGQWAMGIYMNTTDNIIKMNQKRVHQIVGKTPRGYIVIADFGGGLLVTISDGQETDTLIPLLRSITQLVAQ
jgi:predicted regulator of Ras-like GTPase activity (Roadblock/LC7/MglB family)